MRGFFVCLCLCVLCRLNLMPKKKRKQRSVSSAETETDEKDSQGREPQAKKNKSHLQNGFEREGMPKAVLAELSSVRDKTGLIPELNQLISTYVQDLAGKFSHKHIHRSAPMHCVHAHMWRCSGHVWQGL